MPTSLKNLYFGTGKEAFFAATAPKAIYQNMALLEKLSNYMFFNFMVLHDIPSYDYGIYTASFLRYYPKIADDFTLEKTEESKFKRYTESYLKGVLRHELLSQGLFIPDMFKDFKRYYPMIPGLTFTEEEFVFIDYGAKIPYVMMTVFQELTTRGLSITDVEIELYSARIIRLNTFIPKERYPSTKVKGGSKEALSKHIIEYFAGDEPEEYFYNVIDLYLNARPWIRDEVTLSLTKKGITITKLSSVKEYLGYIIFQDVSIEAMEFCVANMDLKEKGPINDLKKRQKQYGENLPEEKKVSYKEKKERYEENKKKLKRINERSHIDKTIEITEYYYKISTMTDEELDDEDFMETITPEYIKSGASPLHIWKYKIGLKEYNKKQTKKE